MPETAETKSRKGVIIALVSVIVLLVVVGAGVALSKRKAPTAAVVTTAPSQSSADAAANAYEQAFNTMNAQLNSDTASVNTAMQTNGDPAAGTAAINMEITHLQAFDATMRTITFPSGDRADASAVISADAAFENGLGQLAINTDDISNYNSNLDSVTPLRATFASATTTLASDLGLAPTGG